MVDSIGVLDRAIRYQYRWKCRLGGYRSIIHVSQVHQYQTWCLHCKFTQPRSTQCEYSGKPNLGMILTRASDDCHGPADVPLGITFRSYCLHLGHGRVRTCTLLRRYVRLTCSRYATFLAPMCGLMVCDYLLVRRGNVKLTSLVC